MVSVSGPASLTLKDNALVFKRGSDESRKVPVEDMALLILDGPEIILSHALISYCMDNGVAVVSSDSRHVPNGLMLPFAGHSLHTETLRSQIEAGVPARKRTWQVIIKAKIQAQSDALKAIGRCDTTLRRLIPFVRSGDPDNVEGTAAAKYFPLIFGEEFIRDRDEPCINARLNYGYSIIRSAVARSVVGAGLHPAIGIHHHNRYNPFCLADDAMEPLRPLVDVEVWNLIQEGNIAEGIDPSTKRRLISLTARFVLIDGQRYPLLVGLEKYAASLRRAICDGEPLLPPIPEYAAL